MYKLFGYNAISFFHNLTFVSNFRVEVSRALDTQFTLRFRTKIMYVFYFILGYELIKGELSEILSLLST